MLHHEVIVATRITVELGLKDLDHVSSIAFRRAVGGLATLISLWDLPIPAGVLIDEVVGRDHLTDDAEDELKLERPELTQVDTRKHLCHLKGGHDDAEAERDAEDGDGAADANVFLHEILPA